MRLRTSLRIAAALVVCAACLAMAGAQQKTRSTRPGSSAAAKSESPSVTAKDEATEQPTPPPQIIIRRQKLHLRPPERYQVSIHLDPARSIRVAAPFDGTVKSVLHKSGERLETAAEFIRMDVTERQLLVERAKALFRAAQIESQRSESDRAGITVRRELAEARLQAAKADLDLAVYRAEQGTLRAPFAAEVFQVNINEGQVVRTGEPLATVGDTASLRTEIPVDRNVTSAGQSVQLKIEDRTVSGNVESILPLAPRFEPLRELLPSAACAVVIIPNPDGRLKVGQTVFANLVPRETVADVPNSAIGNVPDGSHKVQVLRNDVVRDIPIATLAAIGPDRSFVSGPLDAGDELIVSTSQELPDGTLVHSAIPRLAPPVGTAKSAERGEKRGPVDTEPPANKKSGGGL